MFNAHTDILDQNQRRLREIQKLISLAKDVVDDPPELMNLVNLINAGLIQMTNCLHQNITLVYTKGL